MSSVNSKNFKVKNGLDVNDKTIVNEAGKVFAPVGLETRGQVVSTVPNGTPPLVVQSTAKVINLNADLLDGYSAEQLRSTVSSTDTLAEGATNKYFTNGRALNVLLSGLSLSDASVIGSSDTMLLAFGKLQKQTSDNLASMTSHIDDLSNPHSVTKEQVGLANADNTSDANKPLSTAAQAALNLKADKATTYTKTETDSRIQAVVGAAPAALDTLQEIASRLSSDESVVAGLTNTISEKVPQTRTINGYSLSSDIEITKNDIGLGEVDNTSDVNKPISAAVDDALSSKADVGHGHVASQVDGLASVATSGSYEDLTNKPALFSGSYTDLTDKPNVIKAAVPWTANHTIADGTRYLVGDVVYDNGNIFFANYENESIPTSDSLYWTNLGSGNRLNIDGRDIPNITYSQLIDKPTLFSGSYSDLTDKPSIPTVSTVVSAFTNDANYQTETQVDNKLAAFAGMSSATLEQIQSLASTISTKVPQTRTINGYDLSYNISLSKSDLGLGEVDNSSDLNKPISIATQEALNLKVNSSEVADVAFTGSYADLTDKPSIPSVPTLVSAFTNDSNYQTSIQVNEQLDLKANISSLSAVATSGSYLDLSNKPAIPASLSALTNDLNYQTATEVNARIQTVVGAAPAALDTLQEIAAQLANDESAVASLTSVVSEKVDQTRTINGYALSENVTIVKGDIGLENVDNTADANKPISVATQTALNLKANTSSLSPVATTGSYTDLTDKPTLFSGSYTDLTNKPAIPTVPTLVSSFTNDSNYQTATQVSSAIAGKADSVAVYTKAEVDAAIANAISAFAATLYV